MVDISIGVTEIPHAKTKEINIVTMIYVLNLLDLNARYILWITNPMFTLYNSLWRLKIDMYH